MAIYQRWHWQYEKYFYRPIACCNIYSWYIIYDADLREAAEAIVEPGTIVATVEEYEAKTGEKFDPEGATWDNWTAEQKEAEERSLQ